MDSFPSLKGFDFGLDESPVVEVNVEVPVSIPQRVRLRPRLDGVQVIKTYENKFPSLKGFDFGLDWGVFNTTQPFHSPFPSLKGFDFGLDQKLAMEFLNSPSCFHPSKGSTSA